MNPPDAGRSVVATGTVVPVQRRMNRIARVARMALPSLVVAGASWLAASRLVRWGTDWGSTDRERTMRLPGDGYLHDPHRARTVMTRATSIAAPPSAVWPWLAQLGRGAGWYSFDRLDNGGIASARHIVSWIPGPRIGDAAGIGWLRNMDPGRSLTWWLPGDRALGTTVRMVIDIRLEAEGAGSRLVIRVSGDATGNIGVLVLWLFEVVDSIMAVRQLRGIKSRAEAFGARSADPDRPETGDHDQFQLYEAIWVSGERAGVPGREKASRWRRDARAAGAVAHDATNQGSERSRL